MEQKAKVTRIKEMETELTALFGEQSYYVERTACRGKYHGHNDYSIVFGSGYRLYIGIDRRNYAAHLREQLEKIRAFRARQEENCEKIRSAVMAKCDLFTDVQLGILPHEHSKDLVVYAVVILTTKAGPRLVYRTTNMHYYLVGVWADWCGFEKCVAHLLEDVTGEMRYTRLLAGEAITKGA